MTHSNILIITTPERALTLTDLIRDKWRQAKVFNNFSDPTIPASLASKIAKAKSQHIIVIDAEIESQEAFINYDLIIVENPEQSDLLFKVKKSKTDLINKIIDIYA